jgi:hypothetical protein
MAYKLIDTKVDYHRIYHQVHPNVKIQTTTYIHSRILILTLNETIVDKSK